MPDLKNSYFYEDWILDLTDRYDVWTCWNVYHQCSKGVIRRSVANRWAHGEPGIYIQCPDCQAPMPAHLRAVWKLFNT